MEAEYNSVNAKGLLPGFRSGAENRSATEMISNQGLGSVLTGLASSKAPSIAIFPTAATSTGPVMNLNVKPTYSVINMFLKFKLSKYLSQGLRAK